MNFYVYIIAKPKSKEAAAQLKQLKPGGVVLSIPDPYDVDWSWKNRLISIQKSDWNFDVRIGKQNDGDDPKLWFPTKFPKKVTFRGASVVKRGWEIDQSIADDCGYFSCRSAQIHEAIDETPVNPEDKNTFPAWINPIALRLDLFTELPKGVSSEVIDDLLDNNQFDTQIFREYSASDYLRFTCRELLRKQHYARKKQCGFDAISVMERIVFPQGSSAKPGSFDILDALHGTFYIPNFGDGRKPTTNNQRVPTIKFQPGVELSGLGKRICKHVAKQLGYKWEECSPKNPLQRPPEWRHIFLDKPIFTEDQTCSQILDVVNTIKNRFGGSGALKEPLKFIDKVIDQVKEADENMLQPLIGLLPSRYSDNYNVLDFVELFCQTLVVPRSKIIFDFPDGDFNVASNAEDYHDFKTRWSFDLINSPLGGATTFLRRFLDMNKPEDIPDSRYRHGWWYSWQDAIWFNDAETPFRLSNKGSSSKFGKFSLGYSRLGEPDLSGYWHPTQIWFAPAVD